MELSLLILAMIALCLQGYIAIRRFFFSKKSSEVAITYFSLQREIVLLRKSLKGLSGKVDKVMLDAKLATKMAERAFTLASSANIASAILQKNLNGRIRTVSPQQATKDELAKKQLKELFGKDEMEFLKPILTDEEIELYEEAKRQTEKAKANGVV